MDHLRTCANLNDQAMLVDILIDLLPQDAPNCSAI